MSSTHYPLNFYLRRANLHASKPVRMLIFTWERKLYLQSRGYREPHRYVASRHPPPSGKLDCFCKKRNEIGTKPEQTARLVCAGLSRCAKGASFENPKTSYPFKNPQKHDQTTIDVTRNTGAAATAYPEPTNERDHSVQ